MGDEAMIEAGAKLEKCTEIWGIRNRKVYRKQVHTNQSVWIVTKFGFTFHMKTSLKIFPSVIGSISFISYINLFACNILPPPKIIPNEITSNFTIDGLIPVVNFFVDDSNKGYGTHYSYSESETIAYVEAAKRIFLSVSKLSFQSCSVAHNDPNNLKTCVKLLKSKGLYAAIQKYSNDFSCQKSVVFGSSEPWVEAIALTVGCESVTTLEYNNLTYLESDMRIVTFSKHEFDEFYSKTFNVYDLAFSISSFDHDGLGRYGDPIDPYADIKAMNKSYQVLKPGGILFLSLPVGPDLLVFNTLRRYGSIRLPMMLEVFDVIDVIGWNAELLHVQYDWKQAYEPVFVLRKPLNSEGTTSSSLKSSNVRKLSIGMLRNEDL